MSSSSKNKRPMEADPTSASGEEEVQVKKRNPGREEAPALLPMPAGSTGFFIDPKWLNAKIERDKLEAELGLASPVEEQVPTLQDFVPPTTFHTERLLHVRESGSKVVLTAAKSLIGVSSSVGGKPLKRCSVFWIDWDDESKTGTVLTTAHLIRTKKSRSNIWLGGEEYASHANVAVHLLDGTSAEGQFLYYQPHYDVAFVRVKVDQPVQLPSVSEEVKFVQEVFRLGRDNMLDLRITYGRAVYENPNTYERYHNMYFHCAGGANDADEYDSGGPVIDLGGKVVGMSNVSSGGTFIPSSILLKCVDLWKKYEYKYIPRPHLGMTFEAIKLLEPAHVDKIWRMYNIDDGLIVQEVSKGSNAEKFGIQIGDIIECCNGECISTTIELENMLMSICEGSSNNLNGLNVEVNVSGVSHAKETANDRRLGCKCNRSWRSYYCMRRPWGICWLSGTIKNTFSLQLLDSALQIDLPRVHEMPLKLARTYWECELGQQWCNRLRWTWCPLRNFEELKAVEGATEVESLKRKLTLLRLAVVEKDPGLPIEQDESHDGWYNMNPNDEYICIGYFGQFMGYHTWAVVLQGLGRIN